MADGTSPNESKFVKDSFKDGVELRSRKTNIYINPNQHDLNLITTNLTSNNMSELAKQMAEQLDRNYPGISKNLTENDLVQLIRESFTEGPFVRKLEVDKKLICLINEAKGDQITPNKIYETMGVSGLFRPEHLIRLPGAETDWAKLVGEHEGEHCNQTPIDTTDPEAKTKLFTGEVESDRAAIATLRAEGKNDIVTAFKAIRVLASSKGGTLHATSIFFDDPEFTKVTEEHIDAATRFRDEMDIAAASNLGIELKAAQKLRKEDPRKFGIAVEDALNKGDIPALRDLTETAVLKLVSKTMGIDPDKSQAIYAHSASEASAAYQKLKADGALQDRGVQNPHINKYIKDYVDATKVLFIPDTTPPLQRVAEPLRNKFTLPFAENIAPVIETTAEDIAKQEDKDLKEEAENDAAYELDQILVKALDISDEDAAEILKKDPDKYFNAAEKALQINTAPLQTSRRIFGAEREALVAERLGIPLSELGSQPSFLPKMAVRELSKEDALTKRIDNPHLKEQMESFIKKSRQELIDSRKEKDGPSQQHEASKFSYLMSPRQDDGNGIPQIDLRNEDKAQMKIGCLTACEYFATKADPTLAAQAQAVEIKDPTLTNKVAQNSSKYLKTGTGGLQA